MTVAEHAGHRASHFYNLPWRADARIFEDTADINNLREDNPA